MAWELLFGWIAAVSLVSFGLAVVDKSRARRGRSRISERMLLGSALAGGSPGLLLGMIAARHKTRKPSFLLGLLLVLVIQAALVWAIVVR